MNNPIFFFVTLLAMLIVCTGCSNSDNTATGFSGPSVFLVAVNADSTGYCCRREFPKESAAEVSCAETLRSADTAGALYWNDTVDAVLLTPGNFSLYVSSITIDSSERCAAGCIYRINGVQVDSVINWSGFGYVGLFKGHPAAVITLPKTSTIAIGYPGDSASITYRDSIATPAGTTRNNIVTIGHSSKVMQSFSVTPIMVPAGITVTEDNVLFPTFGGNYTLGQSLFKISVSSGLAGGMYSFGLRVSIDNRDYGTVPCTVKVVGP